MLWARKNAWPSVEDLANKELFNRIKEQFTAKVIKVQYLTDKVVEIVIKAPLAAKNFKPGQFFRLQNFETNGRKANNTNLAMEGIAVTGTEVDKKRNYFHYCAGNRRLH